MEILSEERTEKLGALIKSGNMQMNTHKDELIQTKYVNIHGEMMILKALRNGDILFYHEDCNEDFEKVTSKSFNYILNEMETKVLTGFLNFSAILLNQEK
jgi:hypothetical protein